MDQRGFAACQNISVMQWNEGDLSLLIVYSNSVVTIAIGGWQPTTKVSLEELYTEGPGQVPKIISPDTKVYIMCVMDSRSLPRRVN
jgi:hypothetical protein